MASGFKKELQMAPQKEKKLAQEKMGAIGLVLYILILDHYNLMLMYLSLQIKMARLGFQSIK